MLEFCRGLFAAADRHHHTHSYMYSQNTNSTLLPQQQFVCIYCQCLYILVSSRSKIKRTYKVVIDVVKCLLIYELYQLALVRQASPLLFIKSSDSKLRELCMQAEINTRGTLVVTYIHHLTHVLNVEFYAYVNMYIYAIWWLSYIRAHVGCRVRCPHSTMGRD